MLFFIKFYCIYTLSLLILWTIGFGIKKLLKISEGISYISILFNILIGIITYSTIVAIICTKGKTVMIFSVLLGIILYFIHKKEKSNIIQTLDKNHIKQVLFHLIIGATLTYTMFFVIYVRNNFIYIPSPMVDYPFYANLSYQIIHTGVEHCYTNYVMPPSGLQPYHYLELWLNGGIATFTQQNHLSVLLLVTYPTFIFLIYTATCILFKHISIKPAYVPWLAFLITFTNGITSDIGIYQYLEKKFYIIAFINTFWTYHKFAIPYTFVIIAILLFIEKKVKLAYIVLLYTPVFYSTVAPAIFCGTGLYALYLLLFNKVHGRWLTGHLILIATVLFLFYTFFQDKNIVLNDVSEHHYSIKTKINLVGSILIGIFCVYWYIFVLIFLFLRNEVIRIFSDFPYTMLALSITGSSLLLWGFVWNESLDGIQIFTNITIPVLNIVTIGLLVLLLKYKGKRVFAIVFIFVSGSGIYYQLYMNLASALLDKNATKEIEKLNLIQKTFENKSERTGVFLRGKIELNGLITSNIYNIHGYSTSIVYDFSCVFSDGYAVLLNVHEASPYTFSEVHAQKIAQKFIKISVFNRYIEKQKRENRFVSIEKSQLDFIKEYKVSYIATKPNYVLPAHLASLVKEKVDLGDLIIYLLN